MTRPPVTTPRRSFSKREHLAQFLAQDGRCNCGECDGLKLRPGEIHEQHDPPYEIMKDQPGYDGKPKWLWNRECHENYTREVDGPMIVKTRHMGGGKGSQLHRRKRRGGSSIKGPSAEQRKATYQWKKKRKSEMEREAE